MSGEDSLAALGGLVTARFDGWRIVVAAFVSQGVAIGLTLSGYGLFIEPIEAEFGTSRAQANLGIPLILVAGALAGPLIGRALDRGSPRVVMIGGALLLATGLVLLSRAPSLIQAAILLVTVIAVGQAMLGPLAASTVLANWFVARRGTALGIAAIGTTTAGFLIPPIAVVLISRLGWRDTLLVYAAAAVVVAVPVVWALVVKRPEDVGQFPDGAALPPLEASSHTAGVGAREILRSGQFWLVAGVFGLMSGIGIVFLANSVPFASDLGIPRAQAALILSSNAIASSIGKGAFGYVVDRVPMRAAVWASLALQALAWCVFLTNPGFELFLAAGFLFGIGIGSLMPCQGAMVGAIFGRERFGQVSGLLGVFAMLPVLVLPPLVGHLFDASGSYTLPFACMFAVISLPAALLLGIRIPRTGISRAGH